MCLDISVKYGTWPVGMVYPIRWLLERLKIIELFREKLLIELCYIPQANMREIYMIKYMYMAFKSVFTVYKVALFWRHWIEVIEFSTVLLWGD